MKIEGPSSIRPRGKSGGVSASPGFSVRGGEVSAVSASGGLSQASALGAALALQMEAIDPERRRRLLGRGEDALDALQALALALAGAGDGAAVQGALAQARQGLHERTGDAGLDEVLAQIEQRVAVELAKLDRARRVK